MGQTNTLPAHHSYQSHYVDVLDAKMHYLEAGQGDPILFLHGIPTSSYLWRNVLPHLVPYGRCIAPDLIGMGKSSKPKLDYRVFDYIHYLEAFIDALKLTNITLVVHAWGSVIGLAYAKKHPQKIRGIAFLESYLRPEINTEPSLLTHQLHHLLKSPHALYEQVVQNNEIVDHLLLSGTLKKLSESDLKEYRASFVKPEDRKLLWQYLNDLSLSHAKNSDVVNLIAENSDHLKASSIPKLLLYGIPGFQMTMDTVMWAKAHLPKLHLVDLGETLHYPQECNPVAVGEALADWYQTIS